MLIDLLLHAGPTGSPIARSQAPAKRAMGPTCRAQERHCPAFFFEPPIASCGEAVEGAREHPRLGPKGMSELPFAC